MTAGDNIISACFKILTVLNDLTLNVDVRILQLKDNQKTSVCFDLNHVNIIGCIDASTNYKLSPYANLYAYISSILTSVNRSDATFIVHKKR